MTHQLLSADDHMDLCYLPPDLWQTRLPQAWRDAAPRVVMWALDYPHADGTFPHSAESVQQMFSGVKPEIIWNVTYENTRRLYGLPQADAHDTSLRREP